MTRVCWNCDSVDSMFPKEGDYEITVRDKTYIIHGKKSTCVKCGASDIDELYDLMIKEARGFYRKEMGILFPEEIKSIRKKNGLTQEEFAKVLGFSKTECFSCIERGVTQTSCIDEMIRKCSNASCALEVFESNKTKVSDEEYKVIKDKIISSNYQ